MIDIREIDGAIAELENSELSFPRVEKLAALYTVRDKHAAPIAEDTQRADSTRYYSAAQTIVSSGGESEFLRAVSKIDIDGALKVMDELMSVLSLTYPKAYAKVIRKLEALQ